MRRLAFIFAFLTAVFAHADTTVTATVTVTNTPTNGATFSVNGHARTWTNYVTSAPTQIGLSTMFAVAVTNVPSNGATLTNNGFVWTWTNSVSLPSSQVLIGTSPAASATNLFNAVQAYPQANTFSEFRNTNIIIISSLGGYAITLTNSPNWSSSYSTNGISEQFTNLLYAYLIYPETSPQLVTQQTATNTLQFSTMPGTNSLNIIFSPGYAEVVSNTYPITNETVVRVPGSMLGLIEQTNVGNGLVGWFNLPVFSGTNIVAFTNYEWQEFLGTNFGANITNLIYTIGTNDTNFANLIGTNATNFSLSLSTDATNYANSIGANDTNFSKDIGTSITNWANSAFELAGPGLSYLLGSDIYLTNGPGNGTLRMQASAGGFFAFYDEDGSSTPFLFEQNASGTFDTEINDQNDTQRFWAQATANGGGTALQSAGGGSISYASQADLYVAGTSQEVNTRFPITECLSSFPATLIGTVTNFASFSVTGDNIYDTFDFGGNTFTNVGDSCSRTIGLTTLSSATAYEVEVLFNGQVVMDTGTFTSTGAGAMTISVDVTSDGSGTFHYASSYTGANLTPASWAYVGNHGFNTGTDTNFYIDVISYVGSSDITVEMDNAKLAPSTVWRTLP